MKKSMLIIMLLLIAVPLMCSNSIAGTIVQKVQIEPASVIYLPDGTPQNVPAKYLTCIYASGTSVARNCNFEEYNYKYVYVQETAEPDDTTDVPPRRNPWFNR